MVGLPGKLKNLRSKSTVKDSEGSEGSYPVLVVSVLQARDLAIKDRRTGKSDPYLILRLNDWKYTTKVISANLNPVWNEQVEVRLTPQQARSYRFEAICWDHDKFTKKDYLGEFNINLKHHFAMNGISKTSTESKWYTLTSYRKGRKSSIVSGAVQLRFWLEWPGHDNITEADLRAAWQEYTSEIESHEGAKLALSAPDRPVGMHMAEEEDDSSDGNGAGLNRGATNEEETDIEDSVGGGDSDLDDISESDLLSQVDSQAPKPATGKLSRTQRRRQRKLLKRKPFHFKTANVGDVLGVVFLEIDSAKDLPREKNVTKTSFDMDPFVITSFSKKTFRTRVIRHSLNPVFHDRLVLQVHRHEDQYSLKFTIVDRDKLSGNDLVGDCSLPIQDLIRSGPQADPSTGLYTLTQSGESGNTNEVQQPPKRRFLGLRRLTRQNTGGSLKESLSSSNNRSSSPANSDMEQLSSDLEKAQTSDESPASAPEVLNDMQCFDLPIQLAHAEGWSDKARPTIQFKAKFVPYPALRQQFWRVILKHYDADDTGDISRVELTTMLDSLGATLKDSTIDSFFKRFAKTQQSTTGSGTVIDHDGLPATAGLDESLTIDECVICLEDQLRSQDPNKSTAAASSSNNSSSGSSNNNNISRTQSATQLPLTHNALQQAATGSLTTGDAGRQEEFQITGGGGGGGELTGRSDESLLSDERGQEYLISLTHCPLCLKSNMDKHSAVDIVTHLATCASQDWRKVDYLVMGDFVTPSQAQRKWYTKIISKVGYGGYKLGANSANILVQDRRTGQIQEERMSVYVRLGIRLLYKGMKSSRMETGRIKRMLRSMSIKQGVKYDAPSSAKDISSFIAFHQLDMDEVLDPVGSFKSFNAFFYRKLKPGARPCTEPDDPRIAVSPADCRSVVFNSIQQATQIWIKGQNFSLARLFGDAYPDEVSRFIGGSLGIFRLAPQDYHRFHIPVDGTLGEARTIEGQYYTVNPMAIRSNLDVYGENVRVLVPLDSEVFGRVMMVCVGAMMVGSTVITAKSGSRVKRTDELGYFKFGGSTILLIFEPGKFVFDEDLSQNAKESIETLLRVGSSIGHPPGIADAPNESQEETTEQEEKEARQRISGHVGSDNQSAKGHAQEAFSTHNAM